MGLTGMRNGSKIDKAYHAIQAIKDIMRGQLRKKVLPSFFKGFITRMLPSLTFGQIDHCF